MVVIFTVVMAKVGIPQMKEQKNSANIAVRLRISSVFRCSSRSRMTYLYQSNSSLCNKEVNGMDIVDQG
jgi:hypothetical protein